MNKESSLLLDINQIIMTKDFFIKKFDLIKKAYKIGILDFINDKNTAFLSIPLVSISKFRRNFFNNPEFSKELGFFLFSAHRELYSRRKNPLKFLTYLFFLFKEGLSGKKFIFYQLSNKLLDKHIQKILMPSRNNL